MGANESRPLSEYPEQLRGQIAMKRVIRHVTSRIKEICAESSGGYVTLKEPDEIEPRQRYRRKPRHGRPLYRLTSKRRLRNPKQGKRRRRRKLSAYRHNKS
jgi:hypothetical protein